MAERLEAYQFILQFIKEVAPQRSLENVYVVTGDGFFSEDNVKDTLGLVDAHFM